ncbi:TRAP transporter small permease subunit [Roseivivax isoporae]|uniref:TRAP transporter small permease protein n=1 Tax=Roseivivax isoporae LMG 25204 TaxID=1449351 RepID=X7FBB5_9RHOB|nr:TRAP transporter small permease subunit [Roseivivax isoporae]ETX29389.1 permease [Roseivivax isoporae LMG 25204]
MAEIYGAPAPGVRMFGWAMLAAMAAFLANAILTFWFGFPGAGAALSGGGARAVLQVLLYAACIGGALVVVQRTGGRSLRTDAELVTAINALLVRAAFWVVLLVGVGDAAVSFLRVNGQLAQVAGETAAGILGRAETRGVCFHVPLVVLGILIGAVTRGIGFLWLSLLVVAAELLIVLSRFVFSYEQAFMADLVRFWYGALFLFASAYTLLEDGHVRVDLLYASLRRDRQGRVNAVGAVILGMLLCWTILVLGFASSSSVIVGPILVFEVTQSGFGMYVKYFMAGFLGVFAVTMMVQFVAQFFEAVADARGEAGARQTHAEMT